MGQLDLNRSYTWAGKILSVFFRSSGTISGRCRPEPWIVPDLHRQQLLPRGRVAPCSCADMGDAVVWSAQVWGASGEQLKPRGMNLGGSWSPLWPHVLTSKHISPPWRSPLAIESAEHALFLREHGGGIASVPRSGWDSSLPAVALPLHLLWRFPAPLAVLASCPSSPASLQSLLLLTLALSTSALAPCPIAPLTAAAASLLTYTRHGRESSSPSFPAFQVKPELGQNAAGAVHGGVGRSQQQDPRAPR